jgi:heptosyltransferase-2
MDLTEARSVLVTFLMQLGDLVLTTPFFTALRRAAPQARVTALIDEKWLDVMRENPDIDEVLTVDRKGRDNSMSALWRRGRGLRRYSFDYLINLNPSERCSFLAVLSGARYKTGAFHRLFRPLADRPLSLNRRLHAADMYLDVLRRLGADAPCYGGLRVASHAAGEKEAADFYTAGGVEAGDNVAGLNVGSASPSKRWRPERFALVADRLAQEGYKTVFFGSWEELPLVKETASLMNTAPLIATGRFTVGGLCAALKRLNIFITTDSGPMHLAVSQKTPLVALFGPSKPQLYGPYEAGKKAVVVRAPFPCTGCEKRMKHHCPDMRCMNGITVDEVLAAAAALTRG